MTSPNKTLIVVAGPTAVGKTAVSIALARHFGTEVVSADARQLFREMSIGTAKPTPEEMGEVKHHFIGSHSIKDAYSVGDYEAEALQLLENLFSRHQVVVLTGGSGLYVQALCHGLDEVPAADTGIREQLQQELQQQGLPILVEKLSQLDPAYAAQVDVHNPQRVLRGLEVCLATGRPYSSFRTGRKAQRPFRIVKVGLDRDRTELYHRIDHRVDLMLEQGLLEEVKALHPCRNANALQTVGYTELFGFLDGEYGWDEAVRLLKRNSRRYAKRQLTWFRRDPDIRWFHADDQAGLIAYLEAQLAHT